MGNTQNGRLALEESVGAKGSSVTGGGPAGITPKSHGMQNWPGSLSAKGVCRSFILKRGGGRNWENSEAENIEALQPSVWEASLATNAKKLHILKKAAEKERGEKRLRVRDVFAWAGGGTRDPLSAQKIATDNTTGSSCRKWSEKSARNERKSSQEPRPKGGKKGEKRRGTHDGHLDRFREHKCTGA